MTFFELESVLFGPHVHFNIYPYNIIFFIIIQNYEIIMTFFELKSVLFGPHVHFNIYPYDIIFFIII